MKKCNIKIQMQHLDFYSEYRTIGTLDNNILSYTEDNNIKVILDIYNNTMIRDSEDFNVTYVFEIGKMSLSNMLIKDINQQTEIGIFTQDIVKSKNHYKITYNIQDDSYIYEIEFITINN